MSVGVGVVGSPCFDVQGWGGLLPNFDPFGQTEKGGGVQKLDIFHGCHKCMVPNLVAIQKSKVSLKLNKPAYIGMCILELSINVQILS